MEGPPWPFLLVAGSIASCGLVIFVMVIIRACRSCCDDGPKPQTYTRNITNRRRRDVESSDPTFMDSTGFDHPPAYNDIMFHTSHTGDSGGYTGGCDTGVGDSGGGCDSGGGFDSGGGCDSGGGGCDSGGGGCDSGGGGCDSGGGGCDSGGGGCDSGGGGCDSGTTD